MIRKAYKLAYARALIYNIATLTRSILALASMCNDDDDNHIPTSFYYNQHNLSISLLNSCKLKLNYIETKTFKKIIYYFAH